jgi:hypothetical protein
MFYVKESSASNLNFFCEPPVGARRSISEGKNKMKIVQVDEKVQRISAVFPHGFEN